MRKYTTHIIISQKVKGTVKKSFETKTIRISKGI